ncbi:MAG: hypothetical protein KC729_05605 [Candidatus Eisenbacteria bacterium]|uniref:Uncharacterized protein n=1 Tax=Eiseniibacteriota bacterium TaxID=2212470 RepID=A0A956LWR1_UNCEI|nr:hypothetical protein [Candidatus Eisenbacteria bacterium]
MPVERRVVLQPVPENLLPLSVRKLENLEGEIPVYGVVSVHCGRLSLFLLVLVLVLVFVLDFVLVQD